MHNDLKTVEEENKILKEELTKNINIQSILTHQSADGKVGNSIKYFWSFTAEQRCSFLLNNWSWDLFQNIKKNQTLKTLSGSRCCQRLQKTKDHKLIWKDKHANVFSLTAKVKITV